MSLVLLAALIASLATLMTALLFCFRGQARRGMRVAFRWGICVVAYGAVLVAAAMLPREGILRTGIPYCDDDMCMSIESVRQMALQDGTSYRFAVRLFSRANRGPRSAKGASVYLADDRNRRFLPTRDPSAIPFDTDVQPGQAVNTSLSFNVPPDARGLVLAAAMNHLQYGSFVIGNGGDLWGSPRVALRLPSTVLQ